MLEKHFSPSLHFLHTTAAPAVAVAVAAMSLRPSTSYRGGRNQWHSRGFSNRPYAPVPDNIINDNNDASREFLPDYNPPPPRFISRPNSNSSFNHNHNQSFHPPPPRAYTNPYQQLAPPPLYNQNQQFRRPLQPHPYPHPHSHPHSHSRPNQHFRPPLLYNQGQQQPNSEQNQQFRPPPHQQFAQPQRQPYGQFRPQQQFRRPSKPASDYRNWEQAKSAPPSSCERFTVLSYNILADYLAINHRSKLYFHIPRHILDWEFRKRNIMFELGLWSADILCLQEVDRFQDLEEELKIRGYIGIWKMRTGEPVDGCAIFWRSSRFKLLHEEAIEFNKFGLRDNVAQICVLESLNQKSSAGPPSHECSEGRNKVVICNIHVLYNPKRGEIKLGQVRMLLERAEATSKLWGDAPVVLCGDYNSTPKSSLYNFIAEQKLDVSELPRDKISGQYSAEIRPRRPFISNFRTQSNDDATQSNKADLSSTLLTNTTQKNEKPVPQLETKEESEGISVNCASESLKNISSDVTNDETKSDELLEAIEDVSTDATQKDEKPSPQLETKKESEVISVNCASEILEKISPDVTANETKSDELLEAIEDVSIGEDSTSFLSELHGPDETDVADGAADVADSEPFVEYRNTFYDPSGWTPMEIQAATGSSECTTMEHHLKLRSTYSEVEDYSGTRDPTGEPQVTSYHRNFQGTVDYIWRSEGLQTARVLAPIPKHAMEWTPGFPTKRWGSDHVALVAELAFNKLADEENTQTQ